MRRYQKIYQNALREVNKKFDGNSEGGRLKNIGKKISEVRKLRGFTQSKLEKLTGIKRSTIKKIEIDGLSSKKLDCKFLQKFADAFSDKDYFLVTVDDFYDMN